MFIKIYQQNQKNIHGMREVVMKRITACQELIYQYVQ